MSTNKILFSLLVCFFIVLCISCGKKQDSGKNKLSEEIKEVIETSVTKASDDSLGEGMNELSSYLYPDISGFYRSEVNPDYGLRIAKLKKDPKTSFLSEEAFLQCSGRYIVHHMRGGIELDWHRAIISEKSYPSFQFCWLQLTENWNTEGFIDTPLGTSLIAYDLVITEKGFEGTTSYPFNPEKKGFSARFITNEGFANEVAHVEKTKVMPKIDESLEGIYQLFKKEKALQKGIKITKLSDGNYGIYSIIINDDEKKYRRENFNEIALYNPASYPLVSFYFQSFVDATEDSGSAIRLFDLEYKEGSLVGDAGYLGQDAGKEMYFSDTITEFKKIDDKNFSEVVIKDFDAELLERRKALLNEYNFIKQSRAMGLPADQVMPSSNPPGEGGAPNGT